MDHISRFAADFETATLSDGTEPEDLAIYLQGVERYRRWFVREGAERYGARLETILRVLDADIENLTALSAVPEADFLDHEDYRSRAALWHLFHALVTLLELSQWLLARESPAEGGPRSFTEAFVRLAGKGLLPSEKVDVLRSLCRLRNHLAHHLGEPPSPVETRSLLQTWLPELRWIASHMRTLPDC